MLSGDGASVDEANTAAGANHVAPVDDSLTVDDVGTVDDSASVGDTGTIPAGPISSTTESREEFRSHQAGPQDEAGAEHEAVETEAEGDAESGAGPGAGSGSGAGAGELNPMTAWSQSWSTSTENRAGVVPVTDPDLDLTGTPTIDATALADLITHLEAGVHRLGAIQTVGLTNADRRALLMRTEALTRSLFAYSHTWIADLIDQHGLDGIYGSVPEALAVLLRLSMARSGQRILMAEQFGERTTLTGERLPPHLPATTAAAEDGDLGEEHQQIIRKFFKKLGTKVDADTAHSAETQLAQLARELLPDAFTVAARRLYDLLDPDGDLDKHTVADRTYLYLDDPDETGLSTGRMRIDAELRAYLEAAFSKWAKPGMNNPDDTSPQTDPPHTTTNNNNENNDENKNENAENKNADPSLFDTPTSDSNNSDNSDNTNSDADDADADDADDAEAKADADADAEADAEAKADAERARRDRRGTGRRQHDAMKTILRQMLASGQLGQHRGLPVTAVITMTLNELETATGHAITATGSTIAMRDAIRMASHAHHYLVIFDDRNGRALHLARTKRLATADQRIVLIAADRGCTFPGCTRPATWSQTHHIDEWADGGNTDIDTLTFGCDIHHPLVGKADTDWATTKAGPTHPYPGRTLWHPPITLDPLRRGLVNHYHHPNEYIHPSDTPLPGMPGNQPEHTHTETPGTQQHPQTPPPGTTEPGTAEPGTEPGTEPSIAEPGTEPGAGDPPPGTAEPGAPPA